ncbi:858_t:CDS:2, partial [Racocetra persica]
DEIIKQAELCLQSGHYSTALDLIAGASSNLNVPISLKIIKGKALLELNEYQEARKIAIDILRDDPRNPDAHVLRAHTFYVEGDNQEAAAHCLEALRYDPTHSKANTLLEKVQLIESRINAGDEAFKKKDYMTAYEIYTHALTIDPENKPTNFKLYLKRSDVLEKLSNLSESIKDMDKALELNPMVVKILKRRADRYMMLKNNSEAIHDLNAALRIDSTDQEVRGKLDNEKQEQTNHEIGREFEKKIARELDNNKILSNISQMRSLDKETIAKTCNAIERFEGCYGFIVYDSKKLTQPFAHETKAYAEYHQSICPRFNIVSDLEIVQRIKANYRSRHLI